MTAACLSLLSDGLAAMRQTRLGLVLTRPELLKGNLIEKKADSPSKFNCYNDYFEYIKSDLNSVRVKQETRTWTL